MSSCPNVLTGLDSMFDGSATPIITYILYALTTQNTTYVTPTLDQVSNPNPDQLLEYTDHYIVPDLHNQPIILVQAPPPRRSSRVSHQPLWLSY